MKKIVTLLAVLGLGFMLTTKAFAAEADLTLSIEKTTKEEVSVEVETNGNVADGVLAINYDATALSCTEADIDVATEYHAINVESGVIKISFLSEENIPTGSLVKITFDIAPAAQSKNVKDLGIGGNFDQLLNEEGESRVPAGEDVVTIQITEVTDTTSSGGGAGGGSGTGGAGGTGNVNTGDDTVVLPYVMLAIAALVGGAGAAVYYRKK